MIELIKANGIYLEHVTELVGLIKMEALSPHDQQHQKTGNKWYGS